MVEREIVSKSMKMNDSTVLADLSLVDMIRVLISKVSNNDVAELEASEKVSVDYLRKVSALNKFIDKATRKLVEGKENSVTIKLSSEFLPYLDDVTSEKKGKGSYLNFEVNKKNLPQNVEHKFIVKITKK